MYDSVLLREYSIGDSSGCLLSYASIDEAFYF